MRIKLSTEALRSPRSICARYEGLKSVILSRVVEGEALPTPILTDRGPQQLEAGRVSVTRWASRLAVRQRTTSGG